MPTRFLAVALLCLLVAPATAQQTCWEFSTDDPLHTYTDATPHALPDGWTGQVTSTVGSPFPYTEITGGVLRMAGKGGTLEVIQPLSGSPVFWRVTSRFRIVEAACSSREALLMEDPLAGSGGFQAYVGLDIVAINGVSASYTIAPGSWYLLEVEVNEVGNVSDLRIWPDGDPRPPVPIASTTAPGFVSGIRFRAGNSCAPAREIDSVCYEDLSPVPVEPTTWSRLKTLFAD